MTEEEFRALVDAVDRSQTWDSGNTLGALNFLSPRSLLAAAALVRSGEVVSCADPARGVCGPGTAVPLSTSIDSAEAWAAVNETISFPQHGAASMTHLDALGHFSYDGREFGDFTPDAVGPHGLSSHDITSAAGGVVGRGVLIDLPVIEDCDYLHPDVSVSTDSIDDWLSAFACELAEGDIVFVRTGRPRTADVDASGFPLVGGIQLDFARRSFDARCSLIVSDAGMDSPATPVDTVATPWHVLTLTRMGVRLVDVADLEALSDACIRHGRITFLAVIAALPLGGASASPVNPLAVF